MKRGRGERGEGDTGGCEDGERREVDNGVIEGREGGRNEGREGGREGRREREILQKRVKSLQSEGRMEKIKTIYYYWKLREIRFTLNQ